MLNRQSSLPAMRPGDIDKNSQCSMVPGSAVGGKGRGGSLATIKEREEVRSADPSISKSRAMAAAAVQAQMAVKNQPTGYNHEGVRRPGNNRSNINQVH